jgi:kynureninase
LGEDYPREIDDPRRIENLRDPAATIPLAAHVQYWTGDLLAKTLYAAVKHEGVESIGQDQD